MHSQNINLQHTRCFSFQPFMESIVNSQANIFKSISQSKPVEYAQDYLHFIHDFTGLPWWWTIILGTCLLRTVITLPLALYQVIVYFLFINFSLFNLFISVYTRKSSSASELFQKRVEVMIVLYLLNRWPLAVSLIVHGWIGYECSPYLAVPPGGRS